MTYFVSDGLNSTHSLQQPAGTSHVAHKGGGGYDLLYEWEYTPTCTTLRFNHCQSRTDLTSVFLKTIYTRYAIYTLYNGSSWHEMLSCEHIWNKRKQLINSSPNRSGGLLRWTKRNVAENSYSFADKSTLHSILLTRVNMHKNVQFPTPKKNGTITCSAKCREQWLLVSTKMAMQQVLSDHTNLQNN